MLLKPKGWVMRAHQSSLKHAVTMYKSPGGRLLKYDYKPVDSKGVLVMQTVFPWPR